MYVAAYDVESDPAVSVPATRAVAAAHRRHHAPATFFIVTRLLEQAPDQFREILDDDLFDIQSHTHSHVPLKRAPAADTIDLATRAEIERPIELIREIFGREAIGLTAPGAYADGLIGQTALLRFLHDVGICFIRSDGRGPGETVPAPLTQPYWHGAYERADLLEIPAQFWHDNVLKGYTPATVSWPPVVPFGHPTAPPGSPEDEFAVYEAAMDYVLDARLRVCQFAFHPWSLYRMSSDVRTVELLLGYAAEQGFEIVSCRQLHDAARGGRETFPQEKTMLPPVERYDAPRPSFLSAAHHDLRAPMTPILGQAELLSLRMHGPLNEKQQGAADEIMFSSERQDYYFRAVVTAEKAATQRVLMEPEPISVAALARQVEVVVGRFPGAGPAVRFAIDDDAEALLADEQLVVLIFEAMLRNSETFHPGTATVDIRARRDGDRMLFEISDDGPGIADDIAHKIFCPLYWGLPSEPPFVPGLGLGLTIADRLARLMGGKLSFLRERKPGAHFVLELPATDPPGEA